MQIHKNKEPTKVLNKLYLPGIFYLSCSFSPQIQSNTVRLKDLQTLSLDVDKLIKVSINQLEDFRIYNMGGYLRFKIKNRMYGFYSHIRGTFGIQSDRMHETYFYQEFLPTKYYLSQKYGPFLESMGRKEKLDAANLQQ